MMKTVIKLIIAIIILKRDGRGRVLPICSRFANQTERGDHSVQQCQLDCTEMSHYFSTTASFVGLDYRKGISEELVYREKSESSLRRLELRERRLTVVSVGTG